MWSAKCRCSDLPAAWRGSAEFCMPLLIIPGPREPGNIDPMLRVVFQDFAQLGPQGMLLHTCLNIFYMYS